MLRLALPTAIVALVAHGSLVHASTSPLELEAKTPLGDVHGRIDHMAVDAERQRLFVAELGNDSIAVVDLTGHELARTITGLNEPQGLGWVASTDTLVVANAGDGSARFFQGPDLEPEGSIPLGEDADNVRVDEAAHRAYVGWGNGALAIIDADSRALVGSIALLSHPEGFQLEQRGNRIFINVPERGELAVVDRAAGKALATWPIHELHGGFPLALDEDQGRILVAFRQPPTLAAFSAHDGQRLVSVESCGDADDLFLDPKRHRIYVSCGDGLIDVFADHGGTYVRIARVPTARGARTALFVPALDRYFLAVRATATESAAIWIFRPTD